MPTPSQVLDHAERAYARMTSWFKQRSDLALKVRLAAFARQIQAIENALWQILTDDTIDSSVGNQLAVLGRIVGVPAVYEDEDFRVRIKARIRVIKSRGTPEDFYAIFRAVFPDHPLRYSPGYPAGFTFEIDGEISEADAALAAQWLHEAKLGGVKANLIYQTAPNDETFGFAGHGGPGFGDYTAPGSGGVFVGELEA